MSKNLLTYPYHTTSGTSNGITFTINADGSILLNGTSTATVNIFFAPINAFMLPAGNYKMSNGNPNANGYMLIGAEQSEWAGQITGNVEFTKSYYGTVGYCLYQIPRGNTFNNVTIYPSIESTSTIADKLTQIANDIPIIYESGYNSGFSDGLSKGEYDYFYSFWDSFQQNGNRKYYPYAFSFGWNDENFNPQYPLINLSQVTYMFFNSEITNVNVDIGINGIRADAMFSQCKQLQTIKKLIVDENTTFASNSFYQCEALENITIEGTIASDINLQYSTKLSRASVESVINHLSDSTSGTITFNEAVLWNNYTPDAFEELIATKPNWTISLV